jgi:D-lactate dehydrogenase
MGLTLALEAVVRGAADAVVVPVSAGCCGFAGDRGLLVPELSDSALRAEVDELQGGDHDAFVSSSGTCEIGLRRAAQRPFRSFWHLFDAPGA